MCRLLVVTAFFLVSVPTCAGARALSPEQREQVAVVEDLLEEAMSRFGLFTDCEPISLLVMPPERLVRREQLEAAVESRLRGARLFRDDDPLTLMATSGRGGLLTVNVMVIGQAFSILLSFQKPLYDSVLDVTWFAGNWTELSTGTHGGDGGYILQNVSQAVDSFLVQFLRVNELACAPQHHE